MNGFRVVSDNIDVPLADRDTLFCELSRTGDLFDSIIEWLLVCLLAFMPLAFGVVGAWSEEVVVVLSGAIIVCFLLKLVFRRDEDLSWTWCYVPAVVFLFIATLQLIPLPAFLAGVISPNTVAMKTELLGDLPDADALLKSMTLSFYPNATRGDLRLMLAIAAVFVVVLNVFRRPNQIKRLLMAIALIGGAVTVIALAQDLFGNGKIYWVVSTSNTQCYSGPFVNHSHYGQFINLSLGAALGWCFVKLGEDLAGGKITAPEIFEYFSSHSARPLWLLGAIISLGVATVFVSLTRGGMMSMLIAAAFTTVLLAWRQSLKGHGWIVVVLVLAAFSCILYIGFDAVYDRLASIRNLDEYDSRWQILKDLLVSFRYFPILGTGSGTHSVVYPMFDHSTITALASHAENEYAQVMEETGLTGLGSLIIFGIIVWLNYARNIRNYKSPICLAAYGLGFGLLAILLHSLSDFGQHLPANSFLSAIFCALLISLARRKKSRGVSVKTVTSVRKFKGPRIIALLCVCVVWIWALVGADNARIAEAWWEKAADIEKGLIQRNWRGTDAEYADLISCAERALDHQPGNIKYRYWLNTLIRGRRLSLRIQCRLFII